MNEEIKMIKYRRKQIYKYIIYVHKSKFSYNYGI